MANLVEIRPINHNYWAGVLKYKGCHTTLMAYGTRSGALYTGFNKDNSADRERLEGLLGIDLKPSSSYWDTFKIKLGREDLFLNLDDATDELRYIFLKSHKRVQANKQELKPSAEFIIINREEEAVVANNYNRTKRQAILEFGKLSSAEIKKCLRLFGHNPDESSTDYCENALFGIVETTPQRFLDLWVNNKSRDTEFIIKSAVAKSVITKNKSTYKYGENVIGVTLEDAIAYLNDLNNQDVKLAIKSELEKK
jgi:hypothetical protein